MRYNQYKFKVARAPSVTLRSEPPKLISFASGNPCRVPPSSRRKAMFLPTVHPKGVTHYTLQSKACEKGQRIFLLCPLAVGANCVRPRAFTERPYKIDLLSTGKPALWKAPLEGVSFLTCVWSSSINQTEAFLRCRCSI